MTYESIKPEYFEAKGKYDQAQQLISRDRSQARNLLIDASNLLSNCNSLQAKQLAKEVQHLLEQHGG